MGCLKRIAIFLLILLVLFAAFFAVYFGVGVRGWGTEEARRMGPIPRTPAWALECWVWEDDVNTAVFVRELLAGYKLYDIPARTILLDSPWSTRYNDFIVDEELYPEPDKFFTGLQDEGYRVVLWMTCNVDHTNKDTALRDSRDWYEMAKAKRYLMNDGKANKWWKGEGGFVDYTNPEAMRWWRGMQQEVFDWGIDGWKLDGAATLAFNWYGGWFPSTFLTSSKGWLTLRQYMDHYYTDEYEHGLTQNPEFITLARSIDHGAAPFAHPRGFAPLRSAPVTWVGDQDHAWKVEDEGIEEALRDILQAAEQGYGVIGSDVAGYSGGEIPPNVYIRWAQFSTFCGLFLNGGHGERRLWLRTPQELELVREAAWLHTELIPYIYSGLTAQHFGGPTLMRPTGVDYHYEFGPSLLIAPIHEDKLTRTVSLPKGEWRYWYDDKEIITGPTKLTRDFPMDEFPVFVREGAIIPMKIEREYTGIGQADWAAFTTLNLYPGSSGSSELLFYHTDAKGETPIRMNAEGGRIEVTLSNTPVRPLLRVRLDAAPTTVEENGVALPAEAWSYDAATQRLVVKGSEAAAAPREDWQCVYAIVQ